MTSNMKPTFYIAAAALLLAMPACVSKKKYLLAESGRLAALEREADLKERLIASEDENASLSSRLSALLRDTAERPDSRFASLVMERVRKMETAVSHMMRYSSMSPAAAADLIMAYSPDTW